MGWTGSRRIGLVLACGLLAATPPARAARDAGPPVLVRVADVPLPGPPVRFDYQSIDTTANRLYLSHMNAGELLVLDLGTRRLIGRLGNLPRVTGVRCVPALGRVYASVPGHHDVAVIDARTLAVLARVGDVGFPDGIAYAPDVRKVYVSDESGGGECVIDASSNRVAGRIDLGGEAGNTIWDPVSRRILVAVQDRDEFLEIDPGTDRVVGRHALPGSAHPHGLSLDAGRRLLFVASDGNATLQVVDLKTMRVIEQLDVGEDPDVLAFDPVLRRLYVAAETGPVTVFAESNGRLAELGRVALPHAHTVSVDPRTHLVYFPLQNVGGRPMLRIMRPAGP